MKKDPWITWLDVHRDLWQDNEITRRLLAEIKDQELAIGIYSSFGSSSLEWLHSGYIVSLGMNPMDALASAEGIARLKSFLMTVHGW